jgi:hypothetical protein
MSGLDILALLGIVVLLWLAGVISRRMDRKRELRELDCLDRRVQKKRLLQELSE